MTSRHPLLLGCLVVGTFGFFVGVLLVGVFTITRWVLS